MDQESAPPMDEIVWASPMHAYQHGGIHDNSSKYSAPTTSPYTNPVVVLYYFQDSPFFDLTSNNAVTFRQAQSVEKMNPILWTRKAFEGHLKTMSGLEYMVAQEPAEMTPGAGTGVWVIRKQIRRKRSGQEDEITVLATYFVVGLNIYMAPSVGDILGNRLVSIISYLKT